MSVVVPDLLGAGGDPEKAKDLLDSRQLRYTFNLRTVNPANQPTGLIIDQDPRPGTVVKKYTIVRLVLASIYDLDNRPIEGPVPSGDLDGQITGVSVDEKGAWVDFTAQDIAEVNFTLYRNGDAADDDLPRSEWMKRGAMLGLAQRALTAAHPVQLFVTPAQGIQKIRLYKR